MTLSAQCKQALNHLFQSPQIIFLQTYRKALISLVIEVCWIVLRQVYTNYHGVIYFELRAHVYNKQFMLTYSITLYNTYLTRFILLQHEKRLCQSFDDSRSRLLVNTSLDEPIFFLFKIVDLLLFDATKNDFVLLIKPNILIAKYIKIFAKLNSSMS